MTHHIRRYYDRFNSADPLIRIVALIGLVVIIGLAVPRFLPVATSGVDCVNLPSPNADGNNQSLLSQQIASDSSAAPLQLEVVPDRPAIDTGQSLILYVRFINSSMAPLTLFLVPESQIFRFNKEEIGLLISMIPVAENRTLGLPGNSNPPLVPRQHYTSTDLHYLGPRQRCTFRVELFADQLKAAGALSGQYRIRVTYRNTSHGQILPVSPLTPTPVFLDQGVWTGEVQSNDTFVTIGLAPAPVK